MSVSALIDFETLESKPAHNCGVNDIADCRILLGRPASLDLFRELPPTGSFVLISAIDGATVAGGVITWAQSGAPATSDNVLVLNRELLALDELHDFAVAEVDRRDQHLKRSGRVRGVG